MKVFPSNSVSAELAELLIKNTAAKATELGKPMAISVCDQAGELKAFLRTDGAAFIAVNIAQNKAWTAASFGISTDEWYEFVKDDGPLALSIVHTPRLTTFGGGFPIIVDGQVVGGIGVSGGHYSEDMECARSALDKLK
jgi:uncharacterized protein GlcG (DUF336 family)